MKEKIIRVHSHRVFYRVTGKGSPIIILHGWLSSSRAWVTLQKLLSSQGFKVIVPDLPGFGQSPLPNPEGWEINDYTQWVKDFVEALKESKELEKPFTLVGHSFGGRIAIKIAARNSLLEAMNISPKLKEKLKILGYRLIHQKDYLQASPELRQTFQKIIGEDLFPLLPKINLPTLIIWGKKDSLLPVSQAYLFQKNIPGAKLKIIPEAKHSPEIQTPEKLAEIMINFLQKHD